MVRIQALIYFIPLLFVAVSASASPAIPSFEFSVANIQASIAAMRAEQAQAKAGNIGPQIDRLSWDLESYERDTTRLRDDLRWLQQRLRRFGNAPPNNDPSLRWDIQRFTRELEQVARDTQWRLQDLRMLTSQAGKDETLVAQAARLLDAARRFRNETNWLSSDARLAQFDFRRAGYNFEAMDLDRNSRDVDSHAQDLQSEADRLLAKVRP